MKAVHCSDWSPFYVLTNSVLHLEKLVILDLDNNSVEITNNDDRSHNKVNSLPRSNTTLESKKFSHINVKYKQYLWRK